MKDFTLWCNKKHTIEGRRIIYPKIREIWWVDLGMNIGHEQDGVGDLFERPVLIVKTFANGTCLIAPLSKSSGKSKFVFILSYNNIVSYVLLTQIRVISNKRLTRDIRRLETDEFEKIINKISMIYNIK